MFQVHFTLTHPKRPTREVITPARLSLRSAELFAESAAANYALMGYTVRYNILSAEQARLAR